MNVQMSQTNVQKTQIHNIHTQNTYTMQWGQKQIESRGGATDFSEILTSKKKTFLVYGYVKLCKKKMGRGLDLSEEILTSQKKPTVFFVMVMYNCKNV